MQATTAYFAVALERADGELMGVPDMNPDFQ